MDWEECQWLMDPVYELERKRLTIDYDKMHKKWCVWFTYYRYEIEDPVNTPMWFDDEFIDWTTYKQYGEYSDVPISDILNLNTTGMRINSELENLSKLRFSKKLLSQGLPRLIQCPFIGKDDTTGYVYTLDEY